MTIDPMRLREIGWTEWDPIELMRNRKTWIGQPFENEYDSYLIHVADRILAGDGDAALVAYLVAIERDDMYDGSADVSPQRAAATVSAIRQYLEKERLTRIVEAAMPGWKVVDPASQAVQTPVRKVDTVAADIGARKAALAQTLTGESSLAIVEPANGDVIARKTVVIRDGKIIGMQG
ncbi:hypothetical protein O9X98_07795 [Agrobacterium salinitolerans]|nr:hypothetical protein [Agrobacterium salinitolerans]